MLEICRKPLYTILDKTSWDKWISHIFCTCVDLEEGKAYFIPPSPCSMLFHGVCNSPNFVFTTYQYWQHWIGGEGVVKNRFGTLKSGNLVKCLNIFVQDCICYETSKNNEQNAQISVYSSLQTESIAECWISNFLATIKVNYAF